MAHNGALGRVKRSFRVHAVGPMLMAKDVVLHVKYPNLECQRDPGVPFLRFNLHLIRNYGQVFPLAHSSHGVPTTYHGSLYAPRQSNFRVQAGLQLLLAADPKFAWLRTRVNS